MTKIEANVLATLRRLNAQIERVFSYDILAELDVEKCARTVRYHLNKMKAMGLVEYSRGRGWVAV